MSYPPAIASNFGVWEGEATHFSLQGEITTKYSTRLEIGARGNKYSQRNIYTWSDGRNIRWLKICLGILTSLLVN